MKPFAKLIGAALVGALALLAAPSAQAQVRVNVNVGAPAWGPQVPYGTQYYYIPEIDGYYDLYAQQYLVLDEGYWVPLPQLYGYDPYQFHPVVLRYRGREPWRQSSYFHQRYAYQPYCNYGRGGYYSNGYGNGYGRGNYPGGYGSGYGSGYGRNGNPSGGYYGRGRNASGYNDRDNRYGGDRDQHRDDRERNAGYGGGYGGGPRGTQPQPGGNYSNDPRANQAQLPGSSQFPPQPGSNSGSGSTGGGQAQGGAGNGQGNNGNGQGQGGGRHGRD